MRDIERLARRYLPFAPLAIIPLLGLYHLVDVRAGFVGGLVNLVVTLFGVRAATRSTSGDDVGERRVAAALLVAGGAVVWMVGPSGPPDPANLAVLTYNQTGLTLGFLLIVLGATATAAALVERSERTIAAVAATAMVLGLIAWSLESGLGTAMLWRTPDALQPETQWPEWYGALYGFRLSLAKTSEPLMYAGEAGLAYALLRSGLLRRRGAFAMVAFALAEVPLTAALPTIPFGIPAFMALIPYYVGVSLLGSRQPDSTPQAPRKRDVRGLEGTSG